MTALECLLSKNRAGMEIVKKETSSGSGEQRAQEQLVEKALQQPGVAAVMEVFTVASQYVPLPVAPPPDGFWYGTGGNQR